MNYIHLASRLYGTPLLIHEDKAAIIEAVFRRHMADGMLQPAGDQLPPAATKRQAAVTGVQYRQDVSKPYDLTSGGVAVIPILGTLIQRGDWMDSVSGLMSYNRIQTLVESAADDAEVRGILLEIDSNGGEAAGLFELCQTLIAIGKDKPIWSYVNEQAYSAAYALTCATSRILLPPTGDVGSIGALNLFIDQSKRDAQQGYAYTYIFAGARKIDGNPHAPLSDEARNSAQASVDRIYGFFVTHVAQQRGLSEAVVRGTEAATMNADVALTGGYVDAQLGFAAAVADFEREVNPTFVPTVLPGARTAASQTTPKEISMNTNTPAAAATPTADQQAAQAAQAAVVAAARTEAHAEGTQSERKRVGGILGCDEAKGREKLAAHIAYNTEMTVDQAKAMLASASPEAQAPANALAAAMGQVKNPQVGTGGPAAADLSEEQQADALARHIAGVK